MKKRVLFLCTSNRGRSQLAEALVNHDMGDRFEAFSAGSAPKTPHPMALEALAELGIDHFGARSKHTSEFNGQTFDYVISLCNDADQTCPVFLGGERQVRMPFDDPDHEADKPAAFRRVRDEIREQIEAYLTTEHQDEEIDFKLELPE
jgi:arsenate reductase